MAEEKNIVAVSDGTSVIKDSLDLDVAYARLKKIGKDKFMVDLNQKGNIVEKIKSSSQFYGLGLPPEFQEYFINLSDSPLFWIMDTPILSFIEENSKRDEKEGPKPDSDSPKIIKEYYTKWVTTPRLSEKNYFAHSLIKSITKEKSKSLSSSIYGGVLFSFDDTVKDSATAQTYFEQAEFSLMEMEGEDVIKDELKYLLKIYSGFEYFTSNRIMDANQKFKEASVIKNDGITAKFYLALTEIMLGNIETGSDLICDVYEYDISKITYAISTNNFILFQYFLKYPVIEQIFNNREFGKICHLFEDYLQVKELDSNDLLMKLRKKFEVFRELHLNEYHEQEVINNFNFVEKILKNYFTSPLNLFLVSVPILWAKFNDTLQLVLSTIKNRFLTEIQVHLKIYDQNINDLNGMILHLTKEIEDFKVKYKERVKSSILIYESHFKSQMAYLENKLSGSSSEKHNNPADAFKSSITYTFVMASLVLLVSGFAGYSTNYSEDVTGFSQIVKAIFLAGGKWGVLTLVLGFIISVFSAVYAAYERSAEKQRILKEINHLKFSKEKNIENIKSDAEKSERATIKSLNDRIEGHKKRIKDISDERIKREEDLNKQIEVKIAEEAKKLLELIEMP